MHKKELSLADEVMKEVNYDPKLVDQSNQSFKASREFAEQIAPIIQTPRQVVSLVFSILIGSYYPVIPTIMSYTNCDVHSSFSFMTKTLTSRKSRH